MYEEKIVKKFYIPIILEFRNVTLAIFDKILTISRTSFIIICKT